jgi:hypothetical protein
VVISVTDHQIVGRLARWRQDFGSGTDLPIQTGEAMTQSGSFVDYYGPA